MLAGYSISVKRKRLPCGPPLLSSFLSSTPCPACGPALLLCILRGDERIASVMKPRRLLGPGADLKQLVRNILGAPAAAMRRHHAPGEVRLAAIRTALVGQRPALDAELLVRPAPLSSQAAVIAGSLEANHGRRGIGRSNQSRGIRALRRRHSAGDGIHDCYLRRIAGVFGFEVGSAGQAHGAGAGWNLEGSLAEREGFACAISSKSW